MRVLRALRAAARHRTRRQPPKEPPLGGGALLGDLRPYGDPVRGGSETHRAVQSHLMLVPSSSDQRQQEVAAGYTGCNQLGRGAGSGAASAASG